MLNDRPEEKTRGQCVYRDGSFLVAKAVLLCALLLGIIPLWDQDYFANFADFCPLCFVQVMSKFLKSIESVCTYIVEKVVLRWMQLLLGVIIGVLGFYKRKFGSNKNRKKFQSLDKNNNRKQKDLKILVGKKIVGINFLYTLFDGKTSNDFVFSAQ